jgi:hypothetical protein
MQVTQACRLHWKYILANYSGPGCGVVSTHRLIVKIALVTMMLGVDHLL